MLIALHAFIGKKNLSLHYANFIQCGIKINVKNNQMKQYIIIIRVEYKIKRRMK